MVGAETDRPRPAPPVLALSIAALLSSRSESCNLRSRRNASALASSWKLTLTLEGFELAAGACLLKEMTSVTEILKKRRSQQRIQGMSVAISSLLRPGSISLTKNALSIAEAA